MRSLLLAVPAIPLLMGYGIHTLVANMRSPNQGIAGFLTMTLMERSNPPTILDAVKRLAPVDGDVVLEVGAGHGVGIRALMDTKRRLDIWAVEISPAFREKLRETTALPADRIVDADARSLSFLADGSVDKVMAINVVYFLDPLADYLRELHRVLKPGGRLLFGCKWKAAQALGMLGPAGPFKNKDQATVVEAMQAAGFEVTAVDVDLRTGDPRHNYAALEGVRR